MRSAGTSCTRLSRRALAVLRDRKADLPGAATGRVKALRPLFRWAVTEDILAADPARDLGRARAAGKAAVPWTPADVSAFEARHPVGTKARLALAILLYTGMRRSDAVQFGRQHVKDGWISKPQHKGRVRHPQRLELPLLPALAEVIAATPTGDLAFLATDYGRPFSIAGVGNWFRARCNEAGLPHLSAHGMRKAGAALLADRGATAHQLMAIYGWRSLAEAELYTRAADRKRLAREGLALLDVPTVPNGGDDNGGKPSRINVRRKPWRALRERGKRRATKG
jgi:integrase